MSLFELIAALAIISLVVLALFQSSAHWLRLSVRAQEISAASVADLRKKQLFQHVVGGGVDAWPEEKASLFQGNATLFSGLTKAPLHRSYPRLTLYEMRITRESGEGALVYAADEITWVLATFPLGGAKFQYLGADGIWREAWPPAENPEPGPFDDAVYFETPQQPVSVRVDFEENGEQESWIASIRSNPRPAPRLQDALLTTGGAD